MSRTAIALLALWAASAGALSSDAKEFMRLAKELEPVNCEKRKLRREIALGEVQGQDVKALKQRFAALDRDPATAKLQQRLAQLVTRVQSSADPQDLAAISAQHREAYYRCD
jgi:hypothetical protein